MDQFVATDLSEFVDQLRRWIAGGAGPVAEAAPDGRASPPLPGAEGAGGRAP